MPIQRAKPKLTDLRGGTPLTASSSIATSQLPAGSIIQYVEGVSLSATISDSTGSFVDSGITLTITPTSASSKIYLSLTFTTRAPTANAGTYIRINRSIDGGSDTEVFKPAGAQNGLVWYLEASGNKQGTIPIEYVDAPNTTSQIVYKIQFAKFNAGLAYIYGNKFYGLEIKV